MVDPPTDGPVLRLVVGLDKGELRYADLRKLRGIWLADSDPLRPHDIADVTGPQGPDAVGIDLGAFRDALSGQRGVLKATLMDQSVIAGLGNLLTDEICWRARIRPTLPVGDLDRDGSGAAHLGPAWPGAWAATVAHRGA